MKINRIHHVASRCMDANRTVEFYKKISQYGFGIGYFRR